MKERKKAGGTVFDEMKAENREMILSLVRSGRIPHTVILEGGEKEERARAALLLAAGAVCRSDERPCLCCTACRKVLEGTHPDVIAPAASKTSKTGILSVRDLREKTLSQVSIKPNETPLKVYIFYDAERLLREDSQNTLLKIIEEPPQPLLFIFTVERAKLLLETVRSRAHILTLRRSFTPDEEALAAAREIADGVVNLYEYDLLLRLSQLGTKESAEAALGQFSELLRLALLYQSGVDTDDPHALKLARKLDRRRVIELIDVTREAVVRLKTNVNIQLLLTRLCTQYRRITWQK